MSRRSFALECLSPRWFCNRGRTPQSQSGPLSRWGRFACGAVILAWRLLPRGVQLWGSLGPRTQKLRARWVSGAELLGRAIE